MISSFSDTPEFFVLLAPQTEDFLCLVEDTDGAKLWEWTPFIMRAIQFKTFQEAREKAEELVRDRQEGYELAVCHVLVFDDGTHFMWGKQEIIRKGKGFSTIEINAVNKPL
ncbi:hypothetical protein [Microcoleus sp. FACHB-68]|uniref:hypothetical protein n=1 Tax=Microcoleus sp. FACHB-68 TaxID=2692826 RepID=UPI001686B0DD|nr:hypothetical protein [Microcoleus sp. FACHB-68]MBD1935829.1 hypothetical protein [Microcoleus sp. FACHB-68]